jgi:MFS family permease
VAARLCLLQGVGGAFIVANSAAILTDAFPVNQRGFALGINNVAAMSGSFLGLVLGGVLAPIDWRLVFFISVPFGVFGTLWAYLKLEDRGVRSPMPTDWAGNITFASGLVLIMVGVTYGIQPYHGHPMGWSSPRVLSCLAGGLVMLGVFFRIEQRSPYPMFRLSLFRIRAFIFDSLAAFLAALARAVCSSCSSFGSRASGYLCTDSTSPAPRCGPESRCCRRPSAWCSQPRSPDASPTASVVGPSARWSHPRGRRIRSPSLTAGELRIPAVRLSALLQRSSDGYLQLTEPSKRDE